MCSCEAPELHVYTQVNGFLKWTYSLPRNPWPGRYGMANGHTMPSHGALFFENGIQSLSQRHLSINGFMATLIEVMILRTNTVWMQLMEAQSGTVPLHSSIRYLFEYTSFWRYNLFGIEIPMSSLKKNEVSVVRCATQAGLSSWNHRAGVTTGPCASWERVFQT